MRKRVEAGEKMLKAAREMRITSAAGTDIRYKLGQYPVITQYGFTDQPGRWDNLPGGFLYTGGTDGAIDGVVVLNTGDLIFPFKRYLSNPIRMIVEKGMVTRIEGDHLDAELLRAFMARFNDPRAYAVSHIGWGMDEKAQWDFMATSPLGGLTNGVDGRSFYGNVLVLHRTERRARRNQRHRMPSRSSAAAQLRSLSRQSAGREGGTARAAGASRHGTLRILRVCLSAPDFGLRRGRHGSGMVALACLGRREDARWARYRPAS